MLGETEQDAAYRIQDHHLGEQQAPCAGMCVYKNSLGKELLKAIPSEEWK